MAAPIPQNRQEAHFSGVYSIATTAHLVPMIRHCRLLLIGLETFSNHVGKAVKVSSCRGAALQLLKFRMRRANL
jgi:hypothetical protein